eukprot:gene16994-23269_t
MADRAKALSVNGSSALVMHALVVVKEKAPTPGLASHLIINALTVMSDIPVALTRKGRSDLVIHALVVVKGKAPTPGLASHSIGNEIAVMSDSTEALTAKGGSALAIHGSSALTIHVLVVVEGKVPPQDSLAIQLEMLPLLRLTDLLLSLARGEVTSGFMRLLTGLTSRSILLASISFTSSPSFNVFITSAWQCSRQQRNVFTP